MSGMQMMRRGFAPILGAVAFCASGYAAPAWAETEPATLYDARSVGMGGTGTAFIANAAAVYHNPANLDRIEHFSVTAAFTPTFSTFGAPWLTPGTEQNSSAPLLPFGFVGGALRLHERVVLGAGVYFHSGVGSTYEALPALGGLDQQFRLAVLEAALPLSIRILDNLSLGVGLRLPFGFLDSKTFNATLGGNAEQSLRGVSYPGAHLGILYRPLSWLSLALTYRSKTKIDMHGDTLLPGVGKFDSEGNWSMPHSLRLGTAFTFLDERLTLALDSRVQFYKESSKRLVSSAETQAVLGQDTTNTVELQWKNSASFHLGLEYFFNRFFGLRAGYALVMSATPAETVSPFTLPPGLVHEPTLGAGFRLASFEIDLAAAYALGRHRQSLPSLNGGPGDYTYDTWLLSLSASYTL